MADYQNFVHGAVQYPLPLSGSGIGGSGASFLRDADPALFFLLEFYASVINTHVGARFAAEATAINSSISSVVAETLPLDPEKYLLDAHTSFPLLAAWQTETKFIYRGQRKLSVDSYDITYVLPPISPGEAERLLPVLRSVANVINNRTEIGLDPSYTPSGSTQGANAWTLAGIARAEVKSVKYGGYAQEPQLYYPAVRLSLELEEIGDFALGPLTTFAGSDNAIDLASPTDTTVADFVDVNIDVSPP